MTHPDEAGPVLGKDRDDAAAPRPPGESGRVDPSPSKGKSAPASPRTPGEGGTADLTDAAMDDTPPPRPPADGGR